MVLARQQTPVEIKMPQVVKDERHVVVDLPLFDPAQQPERLEVLIEVDPVCVLAKTMIRRHDECRILGQAVRDLADGTINGAIHIHRQGLEADGVVDVVTLGKDVDEKVPVVPLMKIVHVRRRVLDRLPEDPTSR